MEKTFKEPANNSLFIIDGQSCNDKTVSLNTTGLYRIAWLLDGDANFTVDALALNLTQNQIVFFTPHNEVRLENTNCDQLISFSFNREFYCINDHDHEVSCYGHLFYGSNQAPVITLDTKELTRLNMWFDVLEEEFGFQDHVQGEMLRILLKRFLIKSSRMARALLVNPEIKDSKLDIIRQYNVLVEMHFKARHQVQDYADMLFKSPKTLSNLFREYNEKTPLQIINERLELEAKRLLVNSKKTIEEIAYELGYGDGAQFSRFFKKQTDLSPKEFKTQLNRA